MFYFHLTVFHLPVSPTGFSMRVCLVSPEVFAWGYHGGFGFLTRTLGRGFARRGHEVSVVTAVLMKT